MFPDTEKHILEETLAACNHDINEAICCILDGQQGTIKKGMMAIALLST